MPVSTRRRTGGPRALPATLSMLWAWVWACALLPAATACNAPPGPGDDGDGHPRPRVVTAEHPPRVALEPMFGGETFQRALDARQAPGDALGWYVVEQRGLVWYLAPFDEADPEAGWARLPFLDIREAVSRAGNEEGLLGLAFSPHFAEPDHAHAGAFYVNYSVKPGERRSRLARFFAGPRGTPVDIQSEELLLEVAQPYSNHDGGGLVFGPDGMLFWSLGDGGKAGDPHDNGQDPGTLLGTILRLDVSPIPDDAPDPDGAPYRIPTDNPLVGRTGARPEVYAYGLRNAWRFSFDRATGELWAGDVGQNKYESVFVVQPGGNHGWNLMEGLHRYELAADRAVPADLVAPVFEYSHAEGLSVTGGFVYRGAALPELQGWYVFADYITRRVWALRRLPDGAGLEHALLLPRAAFVSSFAEGHDGELLLIDHMASQQVHRLVPAAD